MAFLWLINGGGPNHLHSLKQIGYPKRKLVFQPSIFRRKLLVSGTLLTNWDDPSGRTLTAAMPRGPDGSELRYYGRRQGRDVEMRQWAQR